MQRSRKRTQAQSGDQRRGATAVEFALVVPVFLMLLFGSFEFSRLNMLRSTARNAAYEAARASMVPGATADEATAEANRILGIIGARNFTVVVSPTVIAEDTDEVVVTVTIPFSDNAFMVPFFVGNMNITAASTLKTERYRGQ